MKDEKNREKSKKGLSLNRCDFIKVTGTGIFVFFTIGNIDLLAQRKDFGSSYPTDFDAYLRIGEDGRVSCFSGKIEMDQGIITSLAQMLAEELDMELTSVDMIMGDTLLCPFDFATAGSRSTKYFGPPLRKAAAEARSVLFNLAAENLKENEFEIKPHSKHTVSGKPVQVAWTRKEEFFNDTFRPAAIVNAESGVDKDGKINYRDFEIIPAGTRSSETIYDIPHHRIVSKGGGFGPNKVHPFPTEAWHGPGSNTNVFAMESQTDTWPGQQVLCSM
jgi:CO/xanthine dehydrogenase Mo-binding subunit